jgi:hypothetical protein
MRIISMASLPANGGILGPPCLASVEKIFQNSAPEGEQIFIKFVYSIREQKY